jgi:dolichyl-phosphate beta-glucosyltransferase
MAAPPRDIPLSVVIPAYNEQARLGPTLRAVVRYLEAEKPDFEIVVVDDGSTDRTSSVVREMAAEEPRIRLVELGANAGKGAAVRAGMLAAEGAAVLLAKLERALEGGADIAIASRAADGADIRVRQHPLRELMGRTFNLMVRLSGLQGLRDTQCGFKLFRREAARDLFGRATVDGFAFDVEILVLARGRYRVAEVPVVWRHVEESKVSPGTDAARMFLDLLRIRARHARQRLRPGASRAIR